MARIQHGIEGDKETDEVSDKGIKTDKGKKTNEETDRVTDKETDRGRKTEKGIFLNTVIKFSRIPLNGSHISD